MKLIKCDDIMSRPNTPEDYSAFKDGHTLIQYFECSSCPSSIWTNYNMKKVCKVIHDD